MFLLIQQRNFDYVVFLHNADMDLLDTSKRNSSMLYDSLMEIPQKQKIDRIGRAAMTSGLGEWEG